MPDDDKKLGKQINHIVMGVILGGAIGSVLGLTFAPRKGKETREILKQKSGELIKKGREAGEEFIRDHHEGVESAKFHLKKGKGFFRWLFNRRKNEESMPKASMDEIEE